VSTIIDPREGVHPEVARLTDQINARAAQIVQGVLGGAD
jgi:hypothetical protein